MGIANMFVLSNTFYKLYLSYQEFTVLKVRLWFPKIGVFIYCVILKFWLTYNINANFSPLSAEMQILIYIAKYVLLKFDANLG